MARSEKCTQGEQGFWCALKCELQREITQSDQSSLSASFRKHAYSNMSRILPPKNENFQMKYSGSFQISAQNKDCGYMLETPRRGGSNEYPRSIF